VIVLSAEAEVGHALKLFDDGSDGRGYLLKGKIHDGTQMAEAARTVADGGFVVDPQLAHHLGGEVLQTSLDDEAEGRLREALNAQTPAGTAA